MGQGSNWRCACCAEQRCIRMPAAGSCLGRQPCSLLQTTVTDTLCITWAEFISFVPHGITNPKQFSFMRRQEKICMITRVPRVGMKHNRPGRHQTQSSSSTKNNSTSDSVHPEILRLPASKIRISHNNLRIMRPALLAGLDDQAAAQTAVCIGNEKQG